MYRHFLCALPAGAVAIDPELQELRLSPPLTVCGRLSGNFLVV